MFRASVLVGMGAARRCNGMPRSLLDFRKLTPGYRCVTTIVIKMWTGAAQDKGSLYWLYRRLIDIRRKYVALAEGSYVPLKARAISYYFVVTW